MRSLLAGAMLGTVLLVVTAPPAPAGTTCFPFSFSIAGYHGDGTGAHFGNRVTGPGLWVTNPAVPSNCYIVKSVYVVNNSSNFVEVGWSKDTSGTSTNCDAASGPRLFLYATVQGFIFCDVQQQLNTLTYYGFRVQNPNHDNTWEYYLDGNFEGDMITNFSAGIVYSATERHDTTSTNQADFDGLKWMGASDSWNAYDPLRGEDDDSDYKFCKINNARWQSTLAGVPCP